MKETTYKKLIREIQELRTLVNKQKKTIIKQNIKIGHLLKAKEEN